MQLHNEWRDVGLKLADAFDSLVAHGARARWHAQAAFARMLHGQEPIEYVHGPATPHHLIHEGPLARLLHYPSERAGDRGRIRAKRGAEEVSSRGETGGEGSKPLLIVASLINKYYVMDLLPGVSVIALLARRGFDVYVLDWKAPGAAGPRLDFADYVDGVIPAAAEKVAARHAGALPAVIGYCMGGTLSVMFAARHAERLRALCLLGTPVEFASSGALTRLTDRRRFDADLLMDVLGNMPPAMMQSGFKLLNPADAFNKMVTLLHDAADAERIRHFVTTSPSPAASIATTSARSIRTINCASAP